MKSGMVYVLDTKIMHALTNYFKDVEMNRPGKNGFRTPETKKARKEEVRVSICFS